MVKGDATNFPKDAGHQHNGLTTWKDAGSRASPTVRLWGDMAGEGTCTQPKVSLWKNCLFSIRHGKQLSCGMRKAWVYPLHYFSDPAGAAKDGETTWHWGLESIYKAIDKSYQLIPLSFCTSIQDMLRLQRPTPHPLALHVFLWTSGKELTQHLRPWLSITVISSPPSPKKQVT